MLLSFFDDELIIDGPEFEAKFVEFAKDRCSIGMLAIQSSSDKWDFTRVKICLMDAKCYCRK